MPNFIPSSRPGIGAAESRDILSRAGVTDQVALLGIRGYYLTTMGDASKNDRGIYDDAMVIAYRDEEAATFNANCDPSVHRAGLAVLQPGLWRYRIGIHGLSRPKEKQYRALVQAGPVTVLRDGGKTETGLFGINIHRGGFSTTSSLGCQTIYPPQWPEFFRLVEERMAAAHQSVVQYLLLDETTRRTG